MPKNDREVFDHLVSDKGTALQIDFLTYAVLRMKRGNGSSYSKSERRAGADTGGYRQLDFQSDRLPIRQHAKRRGECVRTSRLRLFRGAACCRTRILRSVIVAEVRAASVWWKQLAVALLTAIVAPVLLGGINAALYFYSTYTTPTDVVNRIRPPAAERSAPAQP